MCSESSSDSAVTILYNYSSAFLGKLCRYDIQYIALTPPSGTVATLHFIQAPEQASCEPSTSPILFPHL